MSKQTDATKIYNELIASHNDRKDIIAEIVGRVGVSSAYASTLYNNARKKSQDSAVLNVAAAAQDLTPAVASGIQSFDRANLKMVRKDLAAALELVEKKHGVKFDQGNIRFSGDNFRMTLRCDVVGDPNVDAEKVKWDNNCFRHGLKPEDYGTTFKDNDGTEFTVCGINPRAKRGGNPVIASNARGTKYIWKARAVRS